MVPSPEKSARARQPSCGVSRPTMVSQHASVDFLKKHYDEVRELGKGSYGRVSLVRERATGHERVCKTVNTAGMTQDVVNLMKKEVELLSTLDHPGVIKLYEYAEDVGRQQLLLILEYLPGGGCDELMKDNSAPLPEALVARRMYQLLVSLEYCHQQGIVHRDVKPENMMLTRKASAHGAADCKLIDFGLADRAKPGGSMFVGTPQYVAPEIIRFEAHTPKVDIWSAGVTAFEMLSGKLPFGKPTAEEAQLGLQQPVFKRILAYGGFADLDVAASAATSWWQSRSSEARDFIGWLLHPDPLQRPTAAEALEHPWLERYEPDQFPITNDITHSFAAFVRAPPVARCCLHIVAGRLRIPDIDALGGIFLSADSDGDGIISADDLEDALENVQGSWWWNPAAEVDVGSLVEVSDFTNSGGISFTAFIAACICARHSSQEELAKQAFHALDSDRDGWLQVDEIRHMFPERDAELLDFLPQDRSFNLREWCGCVEVQNRKEKPTKRNFRKDRKLLTL